MISEFKINFPLSKKDIIWDEWYSDKPELIKLYERVLYFDPTDLYVKIAPKMDYKKRHQGLGMDVVFPKIYGICACGCGEKTKIYSPTSSKKFASDGCQKFASDILSIINNYFGKPAKYMKIYSGHVCDECKDESKKYTLELDHIVGVAHGGGGCWLSNYRWLCKDCHNAKTNKSFGHKSINLENKMPL